MIDLHSHTLFSDGDRTPDQLMAEAAAAGVRVLSVTDHDTVAGIPACAAAAEARAIRLVPGTELSCELNGREVHVLGHFLDPQAPALLRLTAAMQAERRERMEQMVARAQALGLAEVTLARVLACSGGDNLGRPHLARVLVDAGYAASIKDAFGKFLHTRGPLWVDRRRLTIAEAVGFIRGAGGTSSLAHPGANAVSRAEIAAVAELGVDALEAHHPNHPPSQAEAFERWAAERGMLVTAGSDYHGPSVIPDLKLGARTLPLERFAALEALSRSRAAS